MKKLLFTILSLLMIQSVSFAYDASAKAITVGSQMLSKNGLPNATIVVTSDAAATNSNILETNVLYVQAANLSYAGNDNEVAAVISQELGAIVNASASKKELLTSIANSVVNNIADAQTKETMAALNQLSLSQMSTKEVMEADITGVDLMINAGYNPLAMIVILGKMDGSLMEAVTGKPANIKRTMNIYDYLSYNYPSKVASGYNCQEYKAFLAYIAPTIEKRKNSAKEQKKFEKTQAKARAKRVNQVAKYKLTGGQSGWDVSKALLQNMANQGEVK